MLADLLRQRIKWEILDHMLVDAPMTRSVIESDRIIIRPTELEDVYFVLSAESDESNAVFVLQWSEQLHLNAIQDEDCLHTIIESNLDGRKLGFLILRGITDPNKSIELMRIVVTEKGSGYGREAVQLVKQHSFEKLSAHKLWLDVADFNERAQHLYKSEGFAEEEILRKSLQKKDGDCSFIVMSILGQEYKKLGNKN